MDARQVDLGRARREARALLRAAREGDHVATARLRAGGTEDPRAARLADAQRTIARELGARSWLGLVAGAGAVREAFDAGELGWRAQAAHLRALAETPGVAARGVGPAAPGGGPVPRGDGVACTPRDGFAVRSGAWSNTENGVVADAGDVGEVLRWLSGAPAMWLVREPAPALLAELQAAGVLPGVTHAVGGSTPGALSFYGRLGARVMGAPPDRVWYLPAD